ncbi:MAG: polyphosphate kinase 1 [Candidatus Omnitrophica bacterium]|nr:polyphosphate kinase 1 [Candidatus Omnitrophota bacterium]
MKRTNSDREKYIPRDYSWLLFNERVLNEATDLSNPVLERAKFCAIFVSNMDEFFMVRVASLKNTIETQINNDPRYGYTPTELMGMILDKSHQLIDTLYEIYNDKILKELVNHRIFIKNLSELKNDQKKFIKDYFETTLFPILTPMAVDPGHPFPVLPSKTLSFAVHIDKKGENHLAIVPVPKNIPRLLKLPSPRDEYHFILLEEVIREFLPNLFRGFPITEFTLFRVIRDSEIEGDEVLTADLLKMIDEQVKQRSFANPVYLEVEGDCSSELLGILCEGLNFPLNEVTKIKASLDLTFLFELFNQVDTARITYDTHIPRKIEYDDIFEKIKEQDMLIHMPYQSFFPTVDLIQSAARDPKVLAIKMTLYRTNKGSAIIEALKEAAQNGKQVTTLVEIKARFDEENNIRWTRQLEESGCHVIYGLPGLKVHSKMTLIVREEEGKIRRYVHLSTGNYNEKTANTYTDLGYFTVNEDIARDVSELFNVITGYSQPTQWQAIVTAPENLREYTLALIEREIRFQEKYKNGKIFAKLNSLEDHVIIDKLYQASQAGVKIRIVVRGICCLVPGVKDLSENIEVRSVVGRFLEHTRAFIYNNNDSPRVFIGSADWMARNFDKRIEIIFEINKADLKSHLVDVMNLSWKDNQKAWELTPNQTYQKIKSKTAPFNFQNHLIKLYGT